MVVPATCKDFKKEDVIGNVLISLVGAASGDRRCIARGPCWILSVRRPQHHGLAVGLFGSVAASLQAELSIYRLRVDGSPVILVLVERGWQRMLAIEKYRYCRTDDLSAGVDESAFVAVHSAFVA